MDDENDLDHIFEEYENKDFQESANEPRNEENSANAESNEGQTREVVPVPKRIIRNPRLKFNAERLCGERGIPIVTKHFQNVKFKGKGHEKEDLNKMLSALEHWSHRLFPSMKFEACLKQIEKLGKKRAVQTCLVKIRKDMPILSSDFVHDDDDDEREGEMRPTEVEEPLSEDAFDRLFGETHRMEGLSNLTSTPQNKPSPGVVLGSSFGSSLTEEQRKRIEYNKMLATERRKAKLATNTENSGSQSPIVLDPVLAGTSNSSSQINLELQFDSLFDEPTTKLKNSHSDNNQLTNEDYQMGSQDYDETQELSSNTNQQFESLLDKPIIHENVNKTHLDNNQPTDEDYQMGVQDYGETQELSSNINQQFERLVDKPIQISSTSEECKKDYPENHQTCEETEMKPQYSCLDESVESNYKSSEDVFGSMYQDSEKSDTAFEKNDGSMLNESSQTSVMNTCTSIQGDTVKKLSQNIEDSVCGMNTDEPISNASKIGQCQSAFVSNESEADELGLDELMDLVDEDVA